MPSIYRQTYRRPIPEGAEIITRKGERMAKWKTKRGQTRSAPLSEDGTRIVLEYTAWYIDYTDAQGNRQTVRGYRDRAATLAKALELEKQAEQVRSGLLTHDADKSTLPLMDAVEEWLQDLARRGLSTKYRYYCRRCFVHLDREGIWATLGSIRSEGLTRFLADPRRKHLSPRAGNWYLETCTAFVNWCCAHAPPWLPGNPLDGIVAADESEQRAEKRAFTLEELLRIKKASGKRWVIYLTAALTGLRRSELKRLLWGDVILDATQPHLKLRMIATKAKRADSVPLNPELLEAIRAHRPADAKQDDHVFPRMPKPKTYRRDIEERAKIPWRDGLGRLASFHALRKTFGTYLALANVPLRVAMDLMRVTDARLLTGVYNDARLLQTAPAVAMLPRLGGEPAPAETPHQNPDAPRASAQGDEGKEDAEKGA